MFRLIVDFHHVSIVNLTRIEFPFKILSVCKFFTHRTYTVTADNWKNQDSMFLESSLLMTSWKVVRK